VNVVLDKIRSDAAAYAVGQARVLLGIGDKQRVVQASLVQDSGQMALKGDGLVLSGPLNQGPLNGSLTVDNKARKLVTSALTLSADSVDSAVFSGTFTTCGTRSRFIE
jgi:hypothetical protein